MSISNKYYYDETVIANLKHVVQTVCDNGELETKYKEMLFYTEFSIVLNKVVTTYGNLYKAKVKDYAMIKLHYLSVRL